MDYLLTIRFLPLFAILILLEVIFLIKGDRLNSYSWQESLASLYILIGHHLSGLLGKIVLTGIFTIPYQYRFFTIPLNTWWGIVLLFIGLEFVYYWNHRLSHQMRWFWVTHAVHHSSEHFNLSAAYRLRWTGWLSGNFLFFLPLIWLGFPPIAIALGLAIKLTYQFWIHTELIPKLGILELFFNTPSHHRVHHASNSEYIDRNYGGILIIFDRMFGTYAEEKPTNLPIYGLTYPIHSYNPFKITFQEWHRLFQDLSKAKTWGDRSKTICGRPA